MLQIPVVVGLLFINQLPAALANSGATAQRLLLQPKGIAPAHASMSKRSTIELDCIPIFQPMNTNRALYHFAFAAHRFFLLTN